MNYFSNYKLPKICARCGSDHVVDSWNIETTKDIYDFSTLLYMLVGRIRVQKRKFTFRVPVCYTCKEVLQKTSIAITLIPILLIAGGVIAVSIDAGIVMGLFGGLFGYILSFIIIPIIKVATNTKIGSYNGKIFSFSNKRFMNAFATENPDYVK